MYKKPNDSTAARTNAEAPTVRVARPRRPDSNAGASSQCGAM